MRFRAAIFGTLAMLSFAASAGASTIEFHVFNNYFSLNPPGQPIVSDATINTGDTVEWVWDQGFHSVQTVSGSIVNFDSGDHGPPYTYDYTFTEPAKVTFFCDIHAVDDGNGTASGSMQGSVTVVPEPASAGGLGAIALAIRRRRRWFFVLGPSA